MGRPEADIKGGCGGGQPPHVNRGVWGARGGPPRTLYVYSFWAPIVCAFQFLPSCASMHVSICPRLPPVCVFAIFPELKTEKMF